MDKLPIELIQIIGNNIPRVADLRSLATTCRRLYYSLRPRLYQVFIIKYDYDEHSLDKDLELVKAPEIGPYVKFLKLVITGGSGTLSIREDVKIIDEIKSCLDKFPHLKGLEIRFIRERIHMEVLDVVVAYAVETQVGLEHLNLQMIRTATKAKGRDSDKLTYHVPRPWEDIKPYAKLKTLDIVLDPSFPDCTRAGVLDIVQLWTILHMATRTVEKFKFIGAIDTLRGLIQKLEMPELRVLHCRDESELTDLLASMEPVTAKWTALYLKRPFDLFELEAVITEFLDHTYYLKEIHISQALFWDTDWADDYVNTLPDLELLVTGEGKGMERQEITFEKDSDGHLLTSSGFEKPSSQKSTFPQSFYLDAMKACVDLTY